MSRARLSHRLTRAEAAVAHTVGQPAALEPFAAQSDAGELAGEIAASFRRSVEFYREVYKLSMQEAVARAEERLPEYEERVLKSPPQELHWNDLRALSERDPDLALRRWEEVKQAARNERRCGHRAARIVAKEGGSLWERAQFIALYAELTEAWQPRDGQEEQLIHQMAQFQMVMESWQEILASYTMAVGRKRRRAQYDEPSEGPPRVAMVEAVQSAAAMVELLHDRYLRSLRALQDRRRANPSVIVRRAGQVNVAAQQVNICDNR